MIALKVLRDISAYKKPLHVARAVAAKYYLKLSHKTVIGITGSTGKTTTTNAIAAAISNNISTMPNLDTTFNLPITIIDSKKYQNLVLEMGVGQPGDMKFNSWIAPTDIAVFTNLGLAHLQYFKNADAIFNEKSQIISKKTKVIIFNGDDELLKTKLAPSKLTKIIYGFNPNCNVQITNFSTSLKDSIFKIKVNGKLYPIKFPLPGRHQAYSAAAAIAVANYLGEDLNKSIQKLEKLKVIENRLNIIETDNLTVIKDIYNSSPGALKSAIEFASEQKYKTRALVLGDMLELGAQSHKLHQDVANLIMKLKFDYIYTFGPQAKIISDYLLSHKYKATIVHLDKKTKLKNLSLPANTLVLVKGSHGMHMEEFFEK